MKSLKTILTSLPQVTLSPEGVFKYILIQVEFKGETVEFVRGDQALEYHSQNFDKFVKEFNDRKLEIDGVILKANHNVEVKCPGGGRVKHSGSFRLTQHRPRLSRSTATLSPTVRATMTMWRTSSDKPGGTQTSK